MPDGTVAGARAGWGDGAIRTGDCLDVMRAMPANSVDVVVTSPPYNLDLAYNTYSDAMADTDYTAWMGEVGVAIGRVMKEEGSFFLNISGSSTRPYLPFHVLSRLTQAGFHLQNHIVWVKSIGLDPESRGHFKPIPGRRFVHHNHEHIFHLTRTNQVPLDRLSIGIPFQDKSNIARRGHDRDLRCRGNTWFLPYATVRSRAQKFNHPGTFPVELPLWCIYLHGLRDGLVLDPFMGTGTTLVAARLAGVRGLGIDLDQAYAAIAAGRVAELEDGAVDVVLNRVELNELLKQNPSTESAGGWQRLLVGLQRKVNKTTGHLCLTAEDIAAIGRYALKYRSGGWQRRLLVIFGRVLGQDLSGGTATA